MQVLRCHAQHERDTAMPSFYSTFCHARDAMACAFYAPPPPFTPDSVADGFLPRRLPCQRAVYYALRRSVFIIEEQ